MKLKAMLMSIALVLLAACTTNQINSASRLALEAKLADILIQAGEPQENVKLANLTAAELEIVDNSVVIYNQFRQKWQIVGEAQPTQLAENLLLLERDYAELHAAYFDVQNVVLAHWAEYDGARQIRLSNYNTQAISIHTKVLELLAQKQHAETVNTVLQIGLLLAKVAVI